MIETIRISQKAKEQLITLKRNTGIGTWNVLCRWAFCISLAEPTMPLEQEIISDSSVEMTWKVFGGEYGEIYVALLRMRCKNDGLELNDQALSRQFKLHLHRGISYLSSGEYSKKLETLIGMGSQSVAQ